MRSKLLIGIVSAATALSATLILVGCGGGGGPLAPPPNNNGQPSVSAQFLALLPDGQKGATYVGDATCNGCHASSGKGVHRPIARTAKTRGRDVPSPPQIDLAGWQGTQHFKIGVGCEQCHGPGSKHVAAPGPDTILSVLSPQPSVSATTIQSVTNPIVCGQCHADIIGDYESSKHAELVLEPPGLGPGQNGSKTCMRCHDGQFRADLIDNTIDNGSGGPAYNRIATIETNIAALTTSSPFALTTPSDMANYANAAVNTASCADCHDPMRATGVKLNDKGRDLQLLRSSFNDSAANYPGGVTYPTNTTGYLTTFNQSCGVCHAGGTSTGADGRDAKLKSSTSRQSFHENPQYPMLIGAANAGSEYITSNGNPLNQPPAQRNTAHAEGTGGTWDQCVHCHMPNGGHTWTVKLNISCLPCHSADDAQARLAIQGLIQNGLAALRTRMSNWASANLGDPDFWEYTSHISDLGKTPPSSTVENSIPIEIKRARHNYYFILRDASWGVHNRVYTQYLLNIANMNLDTLGIARAPSAQMSRAQVMSILSHDIEVSRRSAARDTGKDI